MCQHPLESRIQSFLCFPCSPLPVWDDLIKIGTRIWLNLKNFHSFICSNWSYILSRPSWDCSSSTSSFFELRLFKGLTCKPAARHSISPRNCLYTKYVWVMNIVCVVHTSWNCHNVIAYCLLPAACFFNENALAGTINYAACSWGSWGGCSLMLPAKNVCCSSALGSQTWPKYLW